MEYKMLLFLFGCIGTRLLMTYVAKTGNRLTKQIIGYLSLIFSVGFLTIWAFGLRKTGAEAGGEIWWNDIRPAHGFLFGLAAYELLSHRSGWEFILLDTIFGFINWFLFRIL